MRICRAISSAATALKRPRAWLLLAFALTTAGCTHPLPEANTYPARLYAQRCGQCHTAYQPRSLTAAMWQAQVQMMQQRMRTAGIPPLSPEQKKIILGYLERNAGGE